MGSKRTEINLGQAFSSCLDDNEFKFFNSLSKNKILSANSSNLKNTLT
ncbi:hypothetical protein KIM322_00200 [Lactobacillus xylocopicola]|uniref:Uncharacterized protein n=1 Tax=Lactobacillus xylocopicola TaxID=2976676 RepID=A0ABM8BEV3_9LACO|nr:hypothetical protein KIM322_00200 [Lactobacillus xylocopicola]